MLTRCKNTTKEKNIFGFLHVCDTPLSSYRNLFSPLSLSLVQLPHRTGHHLFKLVGGDAKGLVDVLQRSFHHSHVRRFADDHFPVIVSPNGFMLCSL